MSNAALPVDRLDRVAHLGVNGRTISAEQRMRLRAVLERNLASRRSVPPVLRPHAQ